MEEQQKLPADRCKKLLDGYRKRLEAALVAFINDIPILCKKFKGVNYFKQKCTNGVDRKVYGTVTWFRRCLLKTFQEIGLQIQSSRNRRRNVMLDIGI